MKIACIGWGSLIWKPESLKIQRQWFNDGPFIPLEFVRQSENGRLTLVINNSSKTVRSLWALMDTEEIGDAVSSLAKRESIKSKNVEKHIGVLEKTDDAKNPIVKDLKEWVLTLKLDAVIWTSLEPKFNNEPNKIPTLQEALQYLSNLEIQKRRVAEEYIRRAPKQIDTLYRQAFEAEFNWTHLA